MDKIIAILALLVSLVHVVAQDYQPKYAANWKEVDDYIHSRWDNEVMCSKDLPLPYISAWPYGHMFYWDSYFINKGLYLHQIDQLVKYNAENLLYCAEKYGFVGNAVVTHWGMNRSQPLYLAQMCMDYLEYNAYKDTNFMKKAYKGLAKEYVFWTDTSSGALEDHTTSVKGLHRFYHHAKPEEIEAQYASVAPRFGYDLHKSLEEKTKIAIPYIVEAATGMDFTGRFEHRCQDFVAVELNVLLYTYEQHLAVLSAMLNNGMQTAWEQKANLRKERIDKVLWNAKRGLYLDYDYTQKRHSKVASIVALQPMWAGMASPEQAKQLVANLPLFESEWGMATTEKCGQIEHYQ